MINPSELFIFYEDNDIIVCEKPPGMPSQSDKTGDYDLVNRIKNYLYEKNPAGGPPYTGVIHRLDRPVGGIMVFAKTPAAAKELSRQVREHVMKKYYLAQIEYDGREKLGKAPVLLTDYIRKEAGTNTSRICGRQEKEAKKAELTYRILQSDGGITLVEIELLTGRHHQIRAQMAGNLGPICGDAKYNPSCTKEQGWKQIRLYAYRLMFKHPRTKKNLTFEKIPTVFGWTERAK